MTIAGAALFMILAAGGLVLTSNVRHCASTLGLYLVGRRRVPWELHHRREVYMRVVGVALAGFAAQTGLVIAWSGAPGWLQTTTFAVPVVAGVGIWAATFANHGDEISDDLPSKRLF